MLLVMLMSVTGAWAAVSQTGYTTLQTDFTQSNHGSYTNMYDYTCNSNQATMVIQTNSPIILTKIRVIVWDSWSETSPNSIKIEGSNDQSEWNTLADRTLTNDAITVRYASVSTTEFYQYFRLTFYGASGSSIVLRDIYIYKEFLDGSGTSQDPYILDKISYLKQYAEFVAGGNNTACAKLTTDFDLNDIDWSPIDNVNFKGTIDGNGHSIKNLKSANGLFKSIGAATIKNLTIENATLSATDEYSGVLAAQANGTTFQNCIVKGTISASGTNTGGLVGKAIGCTFTDCKVSGLNATGTTFGGLAGTTDNGTTFTNCLITSDIIASGSTNVGGLVGKTKNNTTFTNCYSLGNYTVGGANAGALVGSAEGSTTFNKCYAATNLNNDGGVHLPICSNAANASFNNSYYYGTGSEMTVSKADVGSGRLAYLLNNGNLTGPYFQRIGTDAHPSLTMTENSYVYLALDNVNYTNMCPHREHTITSFKAPTCLGSDGNAEYGKCKNSLCGKYFPTSDRNVVTTNPKEFILSKKAVNIQDHSNNNNGFWTYSTSKTKNGTTYYKVMEVTVTRWIYYAGDYELSYTSMDDDPTMKVHLFFDSNMNYGSFSIKFYVNGIERPALYKGYPCNISEQHEIVTVDGLHKFDRVIVVLNYLFEGLSAPEEAHLFVGTEKPEEIRSHNLHKHELSYNCIDGGHKEYYQCDYCESLLTQNTPLNDDNVTTWNNLVLAPKGSHNFGTANPDTQNEGNLYGVQCQNEHCTTFDPDNYVLKNYHNDTDLPLTYDGSTYSTSSPVSLTDGKAYVTPIAFDAPSLTYSRTFYTNVWNPWFVPFTTTVEELAENGITDVACIESIHNYDTDEDGVVDKTVLEVIKKKGGTLKAGVPYMVRTGDNYTYPMEFSDRVMDASNNIKTLHSETISAAYDFMGTYSGLTAGEVNAANIYSLNSEGAMAHRTGLILPQRWYMKEANKDNVYEELSPAMARAFSIRVIGEEDETTGIRTIYPEDEQTEELLPKGIFDLNGRKLSAPQSGKINIINGKKQFVR